MKIDKSWKDWVDENGKNVYRTLFVKCFYEDDESHQLSEKYDVRSYPTGGVPCSLGSSGLENDVCRIFDLYHICEKFVGFETEDLINYLGAIQGGSIHSIGRLKSGEFFRIKKVRGLEVLFPNEALLENQKVQKR